MNYQYPDALVSTEWLTTNLNDPTLRIFDCTMYLQPADASSDAPYRIISGKIDYEQAHIPGAGFIDLQEDLSDNSSKLRFMLPAAEQFATAMSTFGVDENTRVILYSAAHSMWATRIWWMLRAFGFDNAAILDGGWKKWCAENRPISAAPCAYPATTFITRPRPELFVDNKTVLAAIADENTVTVNALSAQYHSGLEPSRYGRPGRVPDSVNVPAANLVNPETQEFIAADQAQEKFLAAGIKPEQQVIAYCGGGIAATADVFLLHQLGYQNLAVYDASLSEWARDESLPMETD